jgi:hypothetical protein
MRTSTCPACSSPPLPAEKIAEQDLELKEDAGDYRHPGASGLGAGSVHDPEKEPLSRIIERLNERMTSPLVPKIVPILVVEI